MRGSQKLAERQRWVQGQLKLVSCAGSLCSFYCENPSGVVVVYVSVLLLFGGVCLFCVCVYVRGYPWGVVHLQGEGRGQLLESFKHHPPVF